MITTDDLDPRTHEQINEFWRMLITEPGAEGQSWSLNLAELVAYLNESGISDVPEFEVVRNTEVFGRELTEDDRSRLIEVGHVPTEMTIPPFALTPMGAGTFIWLKNNGTLDSTIQAVPGVWLNGVDEGLVDLPVGSLAFLYCSGVDSNDHWYIFVYGEQLPSLENNAGKVLAVNSEEDGTEWIDPPSGGSGEAVDASKTLVDTTSGTSSTSSTTIDTSALTGEKDLLIALVGQDGNSPTVATVGGVSVESVGYNKEGSYDIVSFVMARGVDCSGSTVSIDFTQSMQYRHVLAAWEVEDAAALAQNAIFESSDSDITVSARKGGILFSASTCDDATGQNTGLADDDFGPTQVDGFYFHIASHHVLEDGDFTIGWDGSTSRLNRGVVYFPPMTVKELPSFEGNAGKFLRVSSTEDDAEWANLPGATITGVDRVTTTNGRELTADDAGKLLEVGYSANIEMIIPAYSTTPLGGGTTMWFDNTGIVGSVIKAAPGVSLNDETEGEVFLPRSSLALLYCSGVDSNDEWRIHIIHSPQLNVVHVTSLQGDIAFRHSVNTVLEFTGSDPQTVTIPEDSNVDLPVGTIVGVNQLGTGSINIVGDTVNVTVNGVAGGDFILDQQYAGASLYKRGPNEWILQGPVSAAS